MNLLVRCCMLVEAAAIFGPIYVAGVLASISVAEVQRTLRRLGRLAR